MSKGYTTLVFVILIMRIISTVSKAILVSKVLSLTSILYRRSKLK